MRGGQLGGSKRGVHNLCHAKINGLQAARSVHQEVGALEVKMADHLVVEELHSLHDL